MKIYKFISILLVTGILLVTSFVSNAQESTPDPIILIPGIIASWNWEVMLNRSSVGDWDFAPGVEEYDNLISALEEKGYIRDETLFVAFYDWREVNQISATEYLIPVIDQALQNSSSGYVDIIAHSMGGLVARVAIENGC